MNNISKNLFNKCNLPKGIYANPNKKTNLNKKNRNIPFLINKNFFSNFNVSSNNHNKLAKRFYKVSSKNFNINDGIEKSDHKTYHKYLKYVAKAYAVRHVFAQLLEIYISYTNPFSAPKNVSHKFFVKHLNMLENSLCYLKNIDTHFQEKIDALCKANSETNLRHARSSLGDVYIVKSILKENTVPLEEKQLKLMHSHLEFIEDEMLSKFGHVFQGVIMDSFSGNEADLFAHHRLYAVQQVAVEIFGKNLDFIDETTEHLVKIGEDLQNKLDRICLKNPKINYLQAGINAEDIAIVELVLKKTPIPIENEHLETMHHYLAILKEKGNAKSGFIFPDVDEKISEKLDFESDEENRIIDSTPIIEDIEDDGDA